LRHIRKRKFSAENRSKHPDSYERVAISMKFPKLADLRKRTNMSVIKTGTVSFSAGLLRAVLMVGLSFMVLFPLFVKFMASIKSAGDLADPSIIFFPRNPSFQSYKIVFEAVEYPKTILYTIFFTGIISVLQCFSCVLTGYGLARFNFRGKGAVFAMTVFTLVVPPQTILLPLFIRFKYFSLFNLFRYSGEFSGTDLTGTVLPVILLALTANAFKNGLYIFLLRQHFKNMPGVLEEAAYIDGCGPLKTFWKIMLPGSRPMLLAVFLFSFVWQWNDVYYAQTLNPQSGLLANKMFGMSFDFIGTSSAILNRFLEFPKFILLIVPLLVLYLFTQRFFTESIENSGIVG